MRLRRPNERGETLVEVVMALGILSLVLVSSYALATGTFRLGRGAGERTQAVNYLQEQAEALRNYRNNVEWERQFKIGVAAYPTFCMAKETVLGKTQWLPVSSAAAACKVDGVNLAIKATPEEAGEQYKFDFLATWKTGSEDNNVTLTTKLTEQP